MTSFSASPTQLATRPTGIRSAGALFGHSADVELFLHVNNNVYPLTHVAHSYVRLAQPGDVSLGEGSVELIIDGVRSCRAVVITRFDPASRVVRFD